MADDSIGVAATAVNTTAEAAANATISLIPDLKNATVENPMMEEMAKLTSSMNAFLGALLPNLGLAVAFLTAFLLLRPYFPDVYEPKRMRANMGEKLNPNR